MSLSCHSLFAKTAVDGLNRWRDRLLTSAGAKKAGDADAEDEATLTANRRSAIAAARNLGAALR